MTLKRNEFWAGFVHGKLDLGEREMQLFRSKVGAKKVYEDVRKVRIIETARSNNYHIKDAI